MSSTSKPVPVALVGRTVEVGGPVAQALAPEYEVIHFAQGYEAARADLPHVLAGRDPNSSSTHNIGTNNYVEAPRAVIMGRAFNMEDAENLKKLCAESVKTPTLWLLGDPAKRVAEESGPPGLDYARQTASDARAALDKWYAEGASTDGIVLF